jgi:thiamine pyrophosphokinase
MSGKSTIKKRCVLIGAGDRPVTKITKEAQDFLIAVDGGYDVCRMWNLEPDLIVGDLDSMEPENRAFLEKEQGERIVKLPCEKDNTDTLAALRIGLSRGYRDFVLYGCMGGRSDHMFANIQCLLFLKNQGADGTLLTEKEEIFLLQNESRSLGKRAKGFFSIFALQNRVLGVTIRGAKYPLTDALLENDFPIGTSNEFIGEEAVLTVQNGALLVVIQRKGERNHGKETSSIDDFGRLRSE